MQADGSDPDQILTDGWWPKWSPDGQRFAFLRSPLTSPDSDYTQQSLWVADRDGSNPTQILPVGWDGAGSYLGTPNWLPSGRDLVFFGGVASGVIGLQVVSAGYPADGTAGPTPIVITGQGTGIGSAIVDTSVSPDGATVVFVFQSNVWSAAIGGGAATQLTRLTTPTIIANNDPYVLADNKTVGHLVHFTSTGGPLGDGAWGIRTVPLATPFSYTVVLDDGNVNSKGKMGPTGDYFFHRWTATPKLWPGIAKIRADAATSSAVVVPVTPTGTNWDYQPDVWTPWNSYWAAAAGNI